MRSLRSLLAVLGVGVVTAVGGSGTVLTAPLPRRYRMSDRWVSGWSRTLMRVLGLELTVVGQEHAEGVWPAIVMSNHASLLDVPPLFVGLTPSLRMVSKQSLRRVPFLGWGMQAAGFVFIDRSNRERAISSLKRAARQLADGTPVVIFPEGTRKEPSADDDGLQAFKKGGFMLAIESQRPILPVRLFGTGELLPPGSASPRPGSVRLVIGPPIPTASLTADDRDALMQRVRDAILALQDPADEEDQR